MHSHSRKITTHKAIRWASPKKYNAMKPHCSFDNSQYMSGMSSIIPKSDMSPKIKHLINVLQRKSDPKDSQFSNDITFHTNGISNYISLAKMVVTKDRQKYSTNMFHHNLNESPSKSQAFISKPIRKNQMQTFIKNTILSRPAILSRLPIKKVLLPCNYFTIKKMTDISMTNRKDHQHISYLTSNKNNYQKSSFDINKRPILLSVDRKKKHPFISIRNSILLPCRKVSVSIYKSVGNSKSIKHGSCGGSELGSGKNTTIANISDDRIEKKQKVFDATELKPW